MVAVSLLFIYMSFLLCLDPLMHQKDKSASTTNNRQPKHYQRQINDDAQVDNPTQECIFSEPDGSGLQNSRQRSSAVLNLVTHEQSKWRKQVIKKSSTTRRTFFDFSGSSTTSISLQ